MRTNKEVLRGRTGNFLGPKMGYKGGFDVSTFREERMLRRSRLRVEAAQIEKAFDRYVLTIPVINMKLIVFYLMPSSTQHNSNFNFNLI